MPWKISKDFEFDFGHRVWSQILNKDFSLDNSCKCRFFHGHRGKITVSISSDELIDGMVTDFKHLNIFKKFIDTVVDHKFIFDIKDPVLPLELPDGVKFIDHPQMVGLLRNFTKDNIAPGEISQNFANYKMEFAQQAVMDIQIPQVLNEKLEGFVFVNFVPTAENLSQWFFNILTFILSGLPVKVDSVEFFETPKSKSKFFLKQ